MVIAVAAVFVVLECAVVALRFYARKLTRAAIGVDDYVIIVTLFLDLLVCGDSIAIVKSGDAGTHLAVILMKPDGAAILVRWQKILTSLQILYFSAVTAAKVSVCLFYLRVFTHRWFRIAIYILMAIQVTWKQWYPETEGTCFNQNAFYKYTLLPNIITDVLLLILPLPVIWRLKLNLSQRLGLTFVFLLGSIGFVGSCVRFAIFSRTDFTPIHPPGDPTWVSTTHVTWTIVEPGMILIATCLPHLRPLAVRLSSTLKNIANIIFGSINKSMSLNFSPTRTKAADGIELTGLTRLDETPRGDFGIRCDISSPSYGADERHWTDIEQGIIMPPNTIGVRQDMPWSSRSKLDFSGRI